MLKRVLAGLWLGAPRFVRRAGVWLSQPRFTVTAGAVVVDEAGRVLLLRHTLRKGSGWGIPGGFLMRGEQPADAITREVREETGLALEGAELSFVRTLGHVRQVEVIFRQRRAAAGRERRPAPRHRARPAQRLAQTRASSDMLCRKTEAGGW
ncbi:MAG: NUDIX hydrolase [Acidobacteria bacterium]|nr:NUDIX hydrolase [Acidobacteriota bacterium]